MSEIYTRHKHEFRVENRDLKVKNGIIFVYTHKTQTRKSKLYLRFQFKKD